MESKKDDKKPYRKPSLRRIELTAEEVLGTGCKNQSVADVLQGTCTSAPCSQDGS